MKILNLYANKIKDIEIFQKDILENLEVLDLKNNNFWYNNDEYNLISTSLRNKIKEVKL